MRAVPAPIPFADVSHSMCTRRAPLSSSMVPMQPLLVSLPRPVATKAPAQHNRYSPVVALINTTFPGVLSSCKQKLKPVTVNVHVAVFPEVSVAVQVTVVVPTGKGDPGGII